MIQTGQHRQWFATRNLWDCRSDAVRDEAVIYCLVCLAIRPEEVPTDVVIYLAEHCPLLKGFVNPVA